LQNYEEYDIIDIMAKKAIKPAEQKQKRPPGRPTDYRPEYDQRIIDVMSTGASLVEFVAEIGVTRETAYEWARVHPSFSDAFTRARELCQAWWERQGRTHLEDEFADGAGKKFNDRLWNKNMACRFRDDWTENNGADGLADKTLIIEFE